MKIKCKVLSMLLTLMAILFPSIVHADMVHRVMPGETLYIIAKSYDISTKELLEKNQYIRNPRNLVTGQVLIIPRNGYRVQVGDTLYKISQKVDVPIVNLARMNRLQDWNNLNVGQIIYVPNIYTVKSGDTLYKIAKKLNLSMYSLSNENKGVDWNNLRIGETLNIPNRSGQMETDQDVDKILGPTANRFPNTFYYRGSTKIPKIALTFDDGPNREYTTKVLDILKEHDVKATFFILGQSTFGNDDIIKRIVNEGHTIANHSWSHPNFLNISDQEMLSNTKKLEDTLYKITGLRTALIRPPHGFVNDNDIKLFKNQNYKIVKWSVDTLDWRDKDVDKILINSIPNIKNGSIILFHDIRHGNIKSNADKYATIKTLPELIKTLKAQGYRFTTVDNMLGIKPYK